MRSLVRELKGRLRYTSWPIVVAMLALMVIGITAISVSEQADPQLAGHAAKQAWYAGVAVLVFIAAAFVPCQRVGRAAYALFVLTLAALVAVLLTDPINGARRWFDLRYFKVQPSEIAKLTCVVALAWYLRFGDHYRRLRGLVVPFVLALVPMGLILREPDLGTALLFLPTLYFMLFMAGAKLRHLLLIMAMGLAAILFPVAGLADNAPSPAGEEGFRVTALGPLEFYSVDDSLPWRKRPAVPIAYCRVRLDGGAIWDIQPLGLRIIKGHQASRIEGWLRPNDPRAAVNEAFQLRWSLTTLAAGRWKGQDLDDRNDAYADILPLAINQLPEDHTDFIFSVIGGRWGLLGCLAVLGIYAVIFVFGVEIATITYDPFGRLLAIGVLGLLFSQVFINVGMTMGLMPITGMTLPLVSYGGSSLVVNGAALGLLVNVAQRRVLLLSPRPFEHG